MTATMIAPQVASDQALLIARLDGEKAYRQLIGFRIEITLQNDGWHVDYELPLTGVQGGGPHYIIDADSGAIIWKRYDQ